jgi:UDPglucose 6-dehydrogenase
LSGFNRTYLNLMGRLMKISVFGAGYVGLVAAACLAEMGNSVLCVERDPERLRMLTNGVMPIHEPGLEALVEKNCRAGRLVFTHSAESGIAHGTVLFIAVGTPQGADGSADLSQVLPLAAAIGDQMKDYKLIVNKSTVPVGTASRVEQMVGDALARRGLNLAFSVVSNPEFLKEGAAVGDFMRPDRVILGCSTERAELLMRSIYAPFLRNRDRIIVMDARSAEMAKYVANAMLATRISFMNEMAVLAERVGADIEQVRVGIGSDSRIGTHFLYAGCGWGGSCFPKDLSALAYLGQESGVKMSIIQAVVEVNSRQRSLLAQKLIDRYGSDLTGTTVGVWGLAFKPGTDDIREAPSITLIDELLERGARVQAYDPIAASAGLARWGAHPAYVASSDAMAAATQADALMIVTEWREFRSPDFVELGNRMRQRYILDGRNLFDPRLMADTGFDYRAIGRPVVSSSDAAQSANAAYNPASDRPWPEAIAA